MDTFDYSFIQELLDSSPILKAFLAGSLSGTFSTVLFQPLDLVKTRIQQSSMISEPRGQHSIGMMRVMNQVLRNEQISGLWKGMTPSITRTIPGVGLYFSSVHWLTNSFSDGVPSPLTAVTIGVAARSFSAVCLIPITVVKTRFESGEYRYRSITNALTQIYSKEGIRGLTCGLVPTVIRDAPFSGIYLMFYTQLKQAIPPEVLKSDFQAGAQFGCGIVAGILASAVTQPADVVKTKMQLYPSLYPNVTSVLLHLHERYGFRGYFKGLAPRMLRRTLMAAMAWTFYEQATRAMGLK